MKKVILFLCVLVLFLVPTNVLASYNSLTAGISQISLMKSFKDISKNKIVINKMRNKAKILSETDKNIIVKYEFGAVKGENTYLLMNCNLRGNLAQYIPKSDITKPLIGRMDYYANDLAKTISKVKLPQNMILYRGIDERGMNSIFSTQNIHELLNRPVTSENAFILNNKISGMEFVEKGFMSTAYDKKYAKQTKFIFVVKAPQNIQAVLIDGIKNDKELTKEVLINKGYRWKVTDVSAANDGKYYKIGLKLVL